MIQIPPLVCHLVHEPKASLKATFHLMISMRGQRAMGKIQGNNYHHGSCGPSLKGKTSSVSLIFTHETHRNVKNRRVGSSINLITKVKQLCLSQFYEIFTLQ